MQPHSNMQRLHALHRTHRVACGNPFPQTCVHERHHRQQRTYTAAGQQVLAVVLRKRIRDTGNQKWNGRFRRLTEKSSQRKRTATCNDLTHFIACPAWLVTTPFPKHSMLKRKLMSWRCEIDVVRAPPPSSTRPPTTLSFGGEGATRSQWRDFSRHTSALRTFFRQQSQNQRVECDTMNEPATTWHSGQEQGNCLPPTQRQDVCMCYYKGLVGLAA